ncbi:hypothetical protein E2C01_024899 [Portunus trituberculatus]|uniref:Uncharacterized protein n=1 Tax=Portunus trituberculatus TaxID=210409 RepID=A0A5B7EE20_PORTR|nr:hypothetical protein [Portunus trituberculatus]
MPVPEQPRATAARRSLKAHSIPQWRFSNNIHSGQAVQCSPCPATAKCLFSLATRPRGEGPGSTSSRAGQELGTLDNVR